MASIDTALGLLWLLSQIPFSIANVGTLRGTAVADVHRLFRIPELVLEILSMLETKDQYRFGLTCSRIWRVAVPEFWRYKANAKAIQGLLNGRVDRVNANGAVLVREDGWETLLSYGSHIEHLTLIDCTSRDDHSTIKSLSETLEPLCHKAGKLALFPRLRSLHLDIEHDKSMDVCARFLVAHDLTMRLRLLTIAFRGLERRSKQTREYYLFHLMFRCRRLTCLTLQHGLPQSPLLRGAAKFPGLEKLKIDMTSPDPLIDRTLDSSTAFSHLKVLIIRSHLISRAQPDINTLFAAITSLSLAYLEFDCHAYRYLLDTFAVVVTKWKSSLRVLQVHLDDYEDWTAGPKSFDPFMVLTACGQLDGLSIKSNQTLAILDENVVALTSAWPRLRALSILDPRSVSRSAPPTVTMKSLIRLATQLPALHYLAVSVDFCGINHDSFTGLAITSRSSLHWLETARSVCPLDRQSTLIQDVLLRLFPQLKGLRLNGNDIRIREVRTIIGGTTHLSYIPESPAEGKFANWDELAFNRIFPFLQFRAGAVSPEACGLVW